MANSILHLLNVPRELTLDLLATFARFEFALKKAGYAQGDDSKVSPDWDSFGRDVAKLDAALLAPVLNSCQYLQQHPPRKQVLQNGVLHWVARQGTSGSAIGDVLLSVRTVRNNDVAVLSKFLVTDCAFAVLLGDLSVQQLPHLRWPPKFAVSPE